MQHIANPDRFARFETEARALLSLLESGGDPDLTVLTRTLGDAADSMFCGMFSEHDETYWYWVDGVLVAAVALRPGRILHIKAQTWCADHHQQWLVLVPTQLVVEFLDGPEPDVSAATFRIGDARMGTLRNHRERKERWVEDPADWLFEFEVRRPSPPPPLNVVPFVVRLDEWMSANSKRPVVGPEWDYLTREEALEYFESRAAEGQPVSFDETWLDGGPALRIE